jgi:GAF domain-containing protein
MHSAELPPNEDARLRALIDLGVLDSGPEEEFDALVRIASLVCEVPISLISLIDAERQWFKANIGLPVSMRRHGTLLFVPTQSSAMAFLKYQTPHKTRASLTIPWLRLNQIFGFMRGRLSLWPMVTELEHCAS